MDVAEVADRLEIGDLIARYCRVVDTRDWAHLPELFTEDASIDYTAMGGIRGGVAEIVEYLNQAFDLFSSTMHMLGLPAIEIRGDEARAATPCHNPMVFTNGSLLACGLFYHHRFTRTPAGWRISELTEERVHMNVLTQPEEAR